MLKATYLGHSAFLLDDGKYRLIIDPFINSNPKSKIKASEIKADFIYITHAHGDHLGDAIEIARANDSLCIASFELSNYLSAKGLRSHGLHIGGGYNFEFGRIKLVNALHGSTSPDGVNCGPATGGVITMGGRNVYHTGDTGLFSDMKLVGEYRSIDAMFLPIGDNYTMGIEDAVKAVEFVEPKLAIPMHFNTFPIIEADPTEFKKKVESKGFCCRIMGIGETLDI